MIKSEHAGCARASAWQQFAAIMNNQEWVMADDPRCCGTGVCIINPEGYCWCGQKWDGNKMSRPPLAMPPEPATARKTVKKAAGKSAKAGSKAA